LLEQAKARRYVFADQHIPCAVYPWKEERQERLANGALIRVRPAKVSDEVSVQRLFYELSEESTYKRFFGFRRVHSHADMQKFVESDYEHSMALVVCEPEREEIIAMARYEVDPATKLADIAFVVRDDWQQRGVGTVLMRRMAEIARANGLRGFSADVLVSNKTMLSIFHRSGLSVRSRLEGTAYYLEACFEPEPPARSRPPPPIVPPSTPSGAES
jgi:N-acetylglutamate synthase-like GNAT family acetyltransferase